MICSECGAEIIGGVPCDNHFHTLLAWEWDYDMQEMHHLLVLCYHLQHPSYYSPEALEVAILQLKQFVEEGITPQKMLETMRDAVASDVREYQIKGTAEHHGHYAAPPNWTMTIGDVVAAGHENYYDSVRQWAHEILMALRSVGIEVA